MPPTKNLLALDFQAKYQNQQIMVNTTNNFTFIGDFVALEYDRSIILKNVHQFIRAGDTPVPEPNLEQHEGWEIIQRKELLIPGGLIKQIRS